jgi:2',3'-cyclic-nucleotide 2'-phosphodiesterase (5'-nucleotidase family)
VEKIVVDAGDFLSASSKHGEFKAEFLMRGMGDLGYDAVAIGERDLQLGRTKFLELAEKYSVPLVCANLLDAETKELLVDPYVIVSRGEKSMLGLFGGQVKIGIFGVISDKYVTPVSKPGEPPVRATDPVEAAGAVIERLQEEGCNVIVALTHVSVPEAGRIAGLGGITAIVMGHSLSYLREPRFDNGVIVVQGGREGRYIGDVMIEVGQGGDVVSAEGEVLPLDSTIKDDPHFATLINEYKKALEIQAFAPKTTKEEGVDLYVGKTTCGRCHQDQLEQWESTAHAAAFATLEKNNSHFDPDCVGCHVTGYGRGNGFRDARSTPSMANVQCEQCHGPGLPHFRYQSSEGKIGSAEKGVLGPVEASVCEECHKDDHDPDFNFGAKVQGVIH